MGRRPQTTNGQLTAYLTGIFLIMIGLVVAGPWLTMLGSRLLARRARRAATLIAGRRLSDNPTVAFRAVSGLMLALFVTSVASGVISTYVANRGVPDSDSLASTTMRTIIWPEEIPSGQGAPSGQAVPSGQVAPSGQGVPSGQGAPSGQAVPSASAIPAGLAGVPGVRSVNVVYANPAGQQPGIVPGLIACAGLPPEFGSCPPGAQVAAVYPDLVNQAVRSSADPAPPPVWTAADVSAEALHRLPLLAVVVGTDGSTAALEQSRTLLEAAFPQATRPPATDADFASDSTRLFAQFQQLANVVILASLPIAGCSLAVSVAGGLTDRKRPFSMLRLTGVRLAELRRVVLLESAVPLLVVAVLAIGMGFLAAQLFLRSELNYTLVPPSVTYYVLVALGLAVSLGIIASTMPLLRRITGPETARNE